MDRFLSIATDFIYDTARLYVRDIHGKKLVSHGIKIRSVLHTLLVKNKLSCIAYNNTVGSGLV